MYGLIFMSLAVSSSLPQLPARSSSYPCSIISSVPLLSSTVLGKCFRAFFIIVKINFNKHTSAATMRHLGSAQINGVFFFAHIIIYIIRYVGKIWAKASVDGLAGWFMLCTNKFMPVHFDLYVQHYESQSLIGI